MKFVLDSTVGKLARLMRMAGFDVQYVSAVDIPAVLSLSREEQRTIVSRNSRFSNLVLADNFYHVVNDNPEKQFLSLLVDHKLALDPDRFLSRCIDCNTLLVEVEKKEVTGKVYNYVFATQNRFFRCPDCDRIFWHATHAQAMTDKLSSIAAKLDRLLHS